MRRTVRNHHKSQEIKTYDIKYIMQDITNFRYIPSGTVDAKYLAKGTIYRNMAQKELSEWIRWSHSSAKKYMNGLTPASMEIDGIAGWYVRNFYNSESVMSDNFRKRTVDLVKEQVNN